MVVSPGFARPGAALPLAAAFDNDYIQAMIEAVQKQARPTRTHLAIR
ncbi:MAG: hypothetical protein HQ548_00085 [Chloroflexi bacterium]|nr:hypothetical protein [Chloroflexota bacterium]